MFNALVVAFVWFVVLFGNFAESLAERRGKAQAESLRKTPDDLAAVVERIAKGGGTPLVVAEDRRILGVVHLKDTIKPGIADKFAEMTELGIRTIMITGDNP